MGDVSGSERVKRPMAIFASPSPDGFAFQAAAQATTRLPPLVVLITRGMTTLLRAKRTSRTVLFLMVIGIIFPTIRAF